MPTRTDARRDELFLCLLRIQGGCTSIPKLVTGLSGRPLARKHGDRKRTDRRRPTYNRHWGA